ncbi:MULTISPECIES: glycosyltransferase [unclassified Desulfovibrio]|uniref:glycosyltransferase n=1 Tax=unclassified Desulfovibrio TaxID=2593640 RepID=UPI0013EB5395|nr:MULTISPECIES: glycosyltransferase [unclassified Desulfovibrio]
MSQRQPRWLQLGYSTMPLKICLHISTFNPGGAERQIVNLARELAGRGQRVTLLHEQKDVQKTHYLDAIREKGVELVYAFAPDFLKQGIMQSRRRPEFFGNIPAARSIRMVILYLAGALAQLKPDIVHSYLDLTNCTGGCAAFLAEAPVHLASFRNVDPRTGRFPWADLTLPLYRYLLANTSQYFEANSRAGVLHYARWLDIDPGSIAYTPNGIDPSVYMSPGAGSPRELREALALPPAAPIVMTLARFSQEKSPEAMLDIFARVHAAHPEAHYVIAGSGMTDDGEMGAMVRERGLEGTVHLLGVRSDVAPLLSCADVFLLPSRVEGFPNAIMEAMTAGVPVVASNVGGVPDLVRHGEDGFLHEAGDVEGMAESVRRLLADTETRTRLGNGGRQRILEEFSLQKLGDRVLARYAELLEKSGR